MTEKLITKYAIDDQDISAGKYHVEFMTASEKDWLKILNETYADYIDEPITDINQYLDDDFITVDCLIGDAMNQELPDCSTMEYGDESLDDHHSLVLSKDEYNKIDKIACIHGNVQKILAELVANKKKEYKASLVK